MKTARVLTGFLFVVLLATQLLAAEPRTWTSSTGKTKTEAELVRVSGGSVVLKTKDGRELTVPIDQLSAPDQEYLKRFKPEVGEAPAEPPKDPLAPAAGAEMPADRVEIPLGGAATLMRVGGGGQYLIFKIKDKSKIVVVDLHALKVVKEIDAPADCVFAANRKKLLVARASQRLLQRYDLKTMQSEKTVPLPEGDPVLMAVMGYDGNGPLALWANGKIQLWDCEAMIPLTIHGDVVGGGTDYGFGLSVSADGRVFCGWTTGISGQRYGFMRIDGNSVVTARSPDSHSYNGHWAQPNADASYIFRSGGLYSADVQNLALGDLEGAVLMGCADPRFIIGARDNDKKSDLTIYTACDRRPLVSLKEVEHVTAGGISTEQGRLHDEFRVQFLPKMNRIALVPPSNDMVVVRKLDLIDSIRRSGTDYLYVLSSPPTIAGIGDTLRYPIEVVSSAGAPQYKLITGPKDMVVENTGLVRWTIRNKRLGDKEKIVVSVTDGKGQEQFHTWDMIVVSQTPILHKLRRVEDAAAEFATKGKFRTWSDKTKAFQVEAEFVRSSLGKVTLKTRDGRFVTVSLAQLSDADQTYVRERLGSDK